MEEIIKGIEKEIQSERMIVEQETDMRYYHLGYLDALRHLKWMLDLVQKVQS